MQASTVGRIAVERSKADRDLERRVVNYLWSKHVASLRHVSVEADNGVITVSGQVRSFYEKQLVSHCCRRVAGVVSMVDDVEVDVAAALALA